MDFDSVRKQSQADQVRRKRLIEISKAKITHWVASSMRFTLTVECGVNRIQQIRIQTQAGPDPAVTSLRLSRDILSSLESGVGVWFYYPIPLSPVVSSVTSINSRPIPQSCIAKRSEARQVEEHHVISHPTLANRRHHALGHRRVPE